jgi:Cys-tRNA(Pro)/Cys-tRNA(Cys) deacylase
MKKTKAIEILDKAGIQYELRSFEAEELTVEVAAGKLGLPLEDVYKTLVARGDRNGVVMAVVPGPHSLSLRKLAQASGDKRVEMVDVSELMKLTGYLKGGVSPLGSRRAYPLFIDQSALGRERISVSAGQRGLQILIAPADLVKVSGAKLVDLVE